MLHYPQIDPILLHLGPLEIRWYGLMYLLGFLSVLYLGHKKALQGRGRLSVNQIDDALMYGILGVILGGKMGYWFFYQPSILLSQPWELFVLWHPGMSFHGGLIGVVIAISLFSWKQQLHFIDVTDFFMPMVPIGLGLGRLGNFINGELWGTITASPLGMIFPDAGPLPRYPTQLLECFLEGIVLFLVLWCMDRKPQPRYRISGAFLIGYSIARIFCEFFREQDYEWGFLAWNWLTMGQLLCLPMIIAGFVFLKRSQLSQTQAESESKMGVNQ